MARDSPADMGVVQYLRTLKTITFQLTILFNQVSRVNFCRLLRTDAMKKEKVMKNVKSILDQLDPVREDIPPNQGNHESLAKEAVKIMETVATVTMLVEEALAMPDFLTEESFTIPDWTRDTTLDNLIGLEGDLKEERALFEAMRMIAKE